MQLLTILAHTKFLHVCNAVEEHHCTTLQTCSDIVNVGQCDHLDRIVLSDFLHKNKEKRHNNIMQCMCSQQNLQSNWWADMVSICVHGHTNSDYR